MEKTQGASSWPVWLSAGTLAVVGGLAGAKHFGGGLADLQTGMQLADSLFKNESGR